MYFNTEKRTAKLPQDDLSRFLSLMSFRIQSTGFWRKDYNTQADYTSDDIELVYYTRGGSNSIVDGTPCECRTGDLLILPPQSLVTSVNQGYGSYEYLYIHFNVEPYQLESSLAKHLTQRTHVLPAGEDGNKELHHTLQAILREVHGQKEGCYSALDGYLRSLCISILRNQDFHLGPASRRPNHLTERQLVSDAAKAIAQNLERPLKVSELARQFNVSESYLYKSFVNQLQLSPQQYQQQKRIDFACRALRSGDFPISGIASMSGFSTVSAFSAAIRRATGKTPREIMREHES